MQGGEADVVPEQEEAVAQVDGKAQVFGGGPNSASAIAMLLSPKYLAVAQIPLRRLRCCYRAGPFFVAHSNSVCVLVSTVLG